MSYLQIVLEMLRQLRAAFLDDIPNKEMALVYVAAGCLFLPLFVVSCFLPSFLFRLYCSHVCFHGHSGKSSVCLDNY